MVNESELEKFRYKREELAGKIEVLKSKYGRISTLRAISFLVGAALLLIGIKDNIAAAGFAGTLFLFAFIWLVKRHSDVVRQTELEESRLWVVCRYIDRYSDEWRSFDEDGTEYLDQNDTVASDIDLLGKSSLFQMINVCHTERGKALLADILKLESFDGDAVEERREAVEELLCVDEFAVCFEAAGNRLGNRKKKADTKRLEAACAETANVFPVWARICAVLLPAIEITLIILGVFGVLEWAYPLVGFLAVLSFSWLTKSVTDSVILPFYGISYELGDYIDMMKELSGQSFSSRRLSHIHEAICKEGGVLYAFKTLGYIGQAYNICYNPLLHQLLSGIFLWDYQLAVIVSAWKKKYGKGVFGCFDYIAELEVLLSLSVLGRVRMTGWGEITDSEADIKLFCEDIYHPLINPRNVKPNSVCLRNGITVITGSNMSGKTTFLRTVAINLALAYIGAPICGKRMNGSYMRIFTSMRITDDVANGISTFYAEILRIKAMAEYRKENRPMLCLIDEIFKGTNSADRIVGAKEVLKGLSGDRCMTLVSTHDFELCSIQDRDGAEAVNYHFEEYYEEDELKFDYKIKNGRCTTTNAKAILRMAGFYV